MVIDIDSFLDNVDEKKTPEDTQQNEQKTNTQTLDFQKDVENKIQKTAEDSLNKDFEALKQIYEEIKNFDADLPNKFSGIESKSRQALEQLGDKYTQEYLKITKQNANDISNKINSNLNILDQQLQNQNFSKALETFRYILKGYSYFPKALLKEKINLSKKIKNKEIEIYSYLEEFREKKQVSIKKQINENISHINHVVKSGQPLKEIEKSITNLQMILDNIPDLLSVLLIKEKSYATKFLINCENYLLKKYEEEFERRQTNLTELFEKFHEYYIKKDLDNVLLTYNEILYEFKHLPDYFIEKKTELYNKINKLFSSINKLIISVNMSQLVESYEYSKKIESLKDYLSHLENKDNINIQTLLKLKAKVEQFPIRFASQRDELIHKINSIIKNSNQYEEFEKKQNMKQNYSEDYGESKEGSGHETSSNSQSSNSQSSKSHSSNSQEGLSLSSNKDARDPKMKNIYKEIESLYSSLKKSEDSTEIKNLYKKIVFYINNSHMKPSLKSEILKKVNKALLNKKLN